MFYFCHRGRELLKYIALQLLVVAVVYYFIDLSCLVRRSSTVPSESAKWLPMHSIVGKSGSKCGKIMQIKSLLLQIN